MGALRAAARTPHAVALVAAALVLAAPPVPAAAADGAGGVPAWAYYYIWYSASSWNRAKRDYPLLGRYSSDEPTVMRQHIKLAKQVGIEGFIVSWKSTPVLDRRLELIATEAAHQHFRLAIIYQGLDFERRPQPIGRVAMDLDRFVRKFAVMPAFSAGGKPIVIWSGTTEFQERALAQVTSRYRDRLRILASERNAEDYTAKAAAFDGDAYYWSSVNPDTFPGYVPKLVALGRAVHDAGGLWFAPAAPGFNGTLVGHPTVVDRRDGDTLRQEIDAAQRSEPDAIALISWNEFSENSQIEPSHRFGTKAVETLADIDGTHFEPPDDLDSSQADGRGHGIGVIPATIAFGVGCVGGVYLLSRRRRSDAAV